MSNSNLSTSVHHSFDINLATRLKSSDQAILIHHLQYWISFNERQKKNFHEGRYWTYQTLEELAKHFPYWSMNHLRGLISNLQKIGVLIKGNFNKSSLVRTTWYSIDLSFTTPICENPQMDLLNPTNAEAETHKCIYTDYEHTNNKTTTRDPPKKIDGKKVEPSVVVPSFIEEIDGLSDSEKKSLAKYSEERVKLAIEFNKKVKPTTTKIQQLIWHCSQDVPPKPGAKSVKNDLYERCLATKRDYESKTCEMFLSKQCVTFAYQGQGRPLTIDFSEEDAMDKIGKALKRWKFVKTNRNSPS